MEWATQIINQLANIHFSIALIVSFSVGLLTSFNPCMLGMASSIFAFKGESKNKSLFPIALTFMFSFTVTFTILGVVSIFFGDQVLKWTEQYEDLFHNFLGCLFLFIGFYVIGLRFHHFLELLPFRVVTFYAKPEKKQQKPRNPIMKAYSLGTLFGLTPSPCTTPMIIAMIAFASMTGSLVKSTLLLLVYGIGHGTPFLIIGWLARVLKNTEWMVRWQKLLSKVIGVGLFLVGLYFFFE
jgi:cytochrome c biogenesis protein CcdA